MKRLHTFIYPLCVIIVLSGVLSFGFARSYGHKKAVKKLSFESVNTPSAAYLKYHPGTIILKISAELEDVQQENFSLASPGTKYTLSSALQRFGVNKIEKIFPGSAPVYKPKKVDLSRIYQIYFPKNIDALALSRKLAANPQVEYAEPAYYRQLCFVPDDSLYSQQWYFEKIQAEKAWGMQKGDPNVIISIVDTGVDLLHPDLVDKIWTNSNEIPDNGIDDDQNGFIDDIHGWDFGENDNTVMNTTSGYAPGHGSHCAGIAAAATNNRIGVASIGFNSTIMPVKCTRDVENDPDQYIVSPRGFAAIKYAIDNGADIVSCSWSGPPSSDFELEIINYAHERGVAIIAAAGNYSGESAQYPAAYPYVISVAATDQTDRRASLSNYHSTVDIAAPGTDILSVWGYSNDYASNSGTSMAAPLVAGAVALVKAQYPQWTAEQAAQQIRISADDIYDINSAYFQKLGKGRLNVFRALSVVAPAISLESISYSDSTADGDNDGVMDRDETIEVVLSFRNYLANATNVKIKLLTKDPYVTMQSADFNLDLFPGNSVVANSEQPFIFHLSPEIPFGHKLEFRLDIQADNNYSDWEVFSLIVAPLYNTHEVGNVAFTLTSFGAFGYYDYAGSEESVGDGFQYPIGSSSALYHGSVLVGINANQVSDCAYGNTLKDVYDWEMTNSGGLVFSAGSSDQDGFAQYDDHAALAPIGVTVNQKSYAWADPPNDDYVILEFEVENTAASQLSDLYVGLYMDWDVAEYNENLADYDSVHNLGYQYMENSNYFGIALLYPEKAASYRAILNENHVWGDSYPDQLKWQFLTEGFQVTQGDTPKDWSQMLSAGPFSLAKYEKATVTFAVLAGDDLDDLTRNSVAAQAKYNEITEVDSEPSRKETVQHFELSANFPNPFNQATVVRYQLPETSWLKISVFDIQGRLVDRLVEQEQAAGRYSVQWQGKNIAGQAVPSGVYFLQMAGGQFKQTRKIVLVR